MKGVIIRAGLNGSRIFLRPVQHPVGRHGSACGIDGLSVRLVNDAIVYAHIAPGRQTKGKRARSTGSLTITDGSHGRPALAAVDAAAFLLLLAALLLISIAGGFDILIGGPPAAFPRNVFNVGHRNVTVGVGGCGFGVGGVCAFLQTKLLGSVRQDGGEFLHNAVHLRHSPGAVHQLPSTWIGELIRRDEGEQTHGLAGTRRHLQEAVTTAIECLLKGTHVLVLLQVDPVIREEDVEAIEIEPHLGSTARTM
mmetsp:Transcript_2277/g.6643  ORF Transcript_2277/g.6643 Transcript_2277/m.6643 type:complete len:252 (+) Transcript_2277:1911-2666(+)